ncbi:MAG: amidohydrolase [Jatrophihabitantaceae bacterium]
MSEPADYVLTGARIYTLDTARPWASDLAVAGGRVLAVGDDASVAPHQGPGTRLRELDGAFVMPGLVDVHNHHVLAGQAELFELTFRVSTSFEQILCLVRAHARELGPDEWIVGGSWATTLMPLLSHESARHALDAAAGGRPLMLNDDSRHSRFVNTRALELAGITASTVDPERGVIVRDPDTGEPSGLLLESAAFAAEAAVRAGRGLTEQQYAQASRRAIEILHSWGITAFQDAGVSTDIMAALRTLDDASDLHAWVVSCMLVNDLVFGYQPTGEQLIDLGAQYRSEHHRPDFVKIFLDGVPPSRTAAFLEPYLPDGAHGAYFHGALTMAPDELTGWLRRAARAGLSAKIHCTGDASVRAVLDAAAILRGEGYRETRLQIAHGQFVHPDDIARFAQLDVSADISPFIWVPGVIPQAIGTVLPAELAAHMQPNRALLDAGALVAGGTDWPVSESPNAWEGIQGLITRRDPAGVHRGALWPEQAITLAEAIAAFTINSARAMGLDDVTGSLVPGKSADFLVLDRDPFTVEPDTLIQTRVLETVFAGRTVFSRD